MIEDAVQDHFYAGFVAAPDEFLQIVVGSQTAVKLLVIGGFIAVTDGFEQRADVEAGAAEVFDVRDPGDEGVEPVDRLAVFVVGRGAGQAKGINMIINCFVIPCHRCKTPFSCFFACCGILNSCFFDSGYKFPPSAVDFRL